MSIVAISFLSDHWPLATDNCLALLRRSLRGLQRIDGGSTGKSAALSWRLLGFHNHQIPAVRPGHAAFNHQQVVVFIDSQHTQVADGYPRVAHVAGHAHSLKHTGGKPWRADRACDLEHRTVRLRAAAKMMTL